MVDRVIRIRVDPSGANRGIRQVDGNMKQLGGTTDRLQTQLTRVAQAVAAAFSVRQIVAYADAYTNVQNRLRIVTNSTQELTDVTARLLLTANDTRASFEATAGLYATIARSTEELNLSQERLIALTRTINQTFAISGASAQSSANAITQLSQAFASGTLRGEEFNSIADQAPDILRAVSLETGKSRGELREYAATGAITTELLIRSLENYADTAEAELAKTNRTFEQSAVVARNNAIAFVGSSELIQEATAAAGNTLVTLSNNLETVGEILTFVAAIIAGRWVGALSASATDLVAKTRAALAAKVTTDSLGVAIGRTTVAANIGTIAMRGLTASLALLGGPLGLILIAASAFLIFSGNAETTRQETEKLISVNDLLAQSYEGLTAAQAANTRFQIEQQISALRSQQEELRKTQDLTKGLTKDELAAAVAFTGATATAEELGNASSATQAKIDTLDQQIEKLNGRLGELPEAGGKAKDSLISIGDSIDALRSVSSGLDKLFSGEFNLFGDDTSQDEQTAARINQRIEGLRLETQTIASELELQRGVRNEVFTQEAADLAMQTAGRIQQAIAERELLLAEKGITDQQKLETEIAFQEQLALINQQYSDGRVVLAEQEALTVQQIQQSIRDSTAQGLQSGVSLLETFLGKSNAIVKAAKLSMGAYQAFSIYASSQAAAAAALAPPPLGLGPIAGAGLAGAIKFAGAASAASVLAAAAVNTFSSPSGGGGRGFGASGAGSQPQSLPTTPQAAAQVGASEIAGFREIIDELRNQDTMVSTRFVASILDKVQDANRLRGEG